MWWLLGGEGVREGEGEREGVCGDWGGGARGIEGSRGRWTHRQTTAPCMCPVHCSYSVCRPPSVPSPSASPPRFNRLVGVTSGDCMPRS